MADSLTELVELIEAKLPDNPPSPIPAAAIRTVAIALATAAVEGHDDNSEPGQNGANGWSPVIAIISDGERRVQKVTDWTGGSGTKPAANKFIGPDGFVDTAAEATDIRGAAGQGGDGGSIAVPVAFTQNIPFTNFLSVMDTVVSGSLAITPNTTGAVKGYGASLRLVADGVHVPTFSGFVSVGGDNYNNVSGAINQIFFGYNGAEYYYNIARLGVQAGPDVPPTVQSVTANASDAISVVFSEETSGTTAGWSFSQNGTPLTISSRSGQGTDSWIFVIAETMAAGDTITASYSSGTGDTHDTGSNPLASFSNRAVTNSIPNDYTQLFSITFDSIPAGGLDYKENGGDYGIGTTDMINKLELTAPAANSFVGYSLTNAFTKGDNLKVVLEGVVVSGAGAFVAFGGFADASHRVNVPAGTTGTFTGTIQTDSGYSDTALTFLVSNQSNLRLRKVTVFKHN